MSKPTEIECSICDFSGSMPVFEAKERMLGTLDTFHYSECPHCNTLELRSPPANMGAYYPKEYYSFGELKESEATGFSLRNLAKRKVIQFRLSRSTSFQNIAGHVFSDYLPWLLPEYFDFQQSVLDVGSGSGFFLLSMFNAGFTNLKGIDPYNQTDIQYDCGIHIAKTDIFSIKEKYDMIMLHHSFEHMADPQSILHQLNHCLNENGTVLLRIPVADCLAWKLYGPLWVQLDAPRHYFLHTQKGLQILAAKAGFKIDKVLFDSFNLQYWGSELYKAGQKLSAGAGFFPRKMQKEWAEKALENNRNRNGDQVCVYLKKA